MTGQRSIKLLRRSALDNERAKLGNRFFTTHYVIPECFSWGSPISGEARYSPVMNYSIMRKIVEAEALGILFNVVDFIRDRHGIQKINLMGICMGGTFCVIYSALHPEKIKNLLTTVAPTNFETDRGFCMYG